MPAAIVLNDKLCFQPPDCTGIHMFPDCSSNGEWILTVPMLSSILCHTLALCQGWSSENYCKCINEKLRGTGNRRWKMDAALILLYLLDFKQPPFFLRSQRSNGGCSHLKNLKLLYTTVPFCSHISMTWCKKILLPFFFFFLLNELKETCTVNPLLLVSGS